MYWQVILSLWVPNGDDMEVFGPADIGSVLQGVGSLAGAFAVFYAAWLASDTFESWRRQKLSERRIEQAERILTATYKARRGLSNVRSPMIWAHELDAAEEKLKELNKWPAGTADQTRSKTAQSYYNRLNEEFRHRQELEECQPMARALCGQELEQALATLNHQFHTIGVNIRAKHREPEGNIERANSDRVQAILSEGYPHGEDPNEMDERIAVVVKKIEDECVPVLRLEAKG
jgi:hypothetical protein